MKTQQHGKTMTGACLVALALLAAASAVGAVLGAERASALFNSAPLAAFWTLVAASLVAGLAFHRRVAGRPGFLGMHLGALLILLGAMYGSDAGHVFAAKAFSSRKVPSGYVVIREGESSGTILSGPLFKEIGLLPFNLRLNDFSVEHYDVSGARWSLFIDAPGLSERLRAGVDWEVGREIAAPLTDVRLTVLEYILSARAVFAADAKPYLEVTDERGHVAALKAEQGAEAALADGRTKLRVLQVYSHLAVRGVGEARQVVDIPGSSANPAVQVEIAHPDGSRETRYVTAGSGMHGYGDGGIDLAYRMPEPSGAVSDPSTGRPAIRVRVESGNDRMDRWLAAAEGETQLAVPLAPVTGGANTAPMLVFVKPSGPVRDYTSDVSVVEQGTEVARKAIEVNHPLHYGGYHFYQHSYDSENEAYTILSVTSDSGLSVVYAGFILLCLGSFYGCWVRPALDAAKRRKRDGG